MISSIGLIIICLGGVDWAGTLHWYCYEVYTMPHKHLVLNLSEGKNVSTFG